MRFKIALFLLAFITIACIGCKPAGNGDYTVYQISATSQEPGFGTTMSNDTIDNYLHHKLMGARFTVNFKDKFVELHDKGASEPIILAKYNDGPDRWIYKNSEKLGVRTYNFKLKQIADNQLLLQVVIICPLGDALIFPAQFGASDYGSFSHDKFGVAVCYLSKAE